MHEIHAKIDLVEFAVALQNTSKTFILFGRRRYVSSQLPPKTRIKLSFCFKSCDAFILLPFSISRISSCETHFSYDSKDVICPLLLTPRRQIFATGHELKVDFAPRPKLCSACLCSLFHYSARIKRSFRFEACHVLILHLLAFYP